MSDRTQKKHVTLAGTAQITINDPDVIERVTGPGGDEWRSKLYNLHTEEDVLSHLAFNRLFNGVESVNRLDGWADLSDDAATMVRVGDVDLERVSDA